MAAKNSYVDDVSTVEPADGQQRSYENIEERQSLIIESTIQCDSADTVVTLVHGVNC